MPEVHVARIMIMCPERERSVYTGMNFDWDEFDAVPIGEKSVRCPHCGQIHKWGRADAFLEEDGGEG
jgi:hypothetical protein